MTYPAGFEEQQVVGGLTRPTNVAWAPDGRTFIVEKDGLLKVVAPGGSTASLVLDLNTRVNSAHDRGLLGLAVDSQFAQHPYLYLLYTYELNQMTPDSTSPMVSQLLRVRIDSANQVTEQTVLMGTYTSGVCPAPANTLDCLPSEGLSHSIGTVRSAPDGTLWVGNGDAASFSYVDPVALRTYDEQSLAGKLMHVDRNGMGLPGHPFCPGDSVLSHACTKLHAKGFRNPFRFALRPGGGITLGDVGWDQREEIDLISTAVGGLSYGWPCYEGSGQTNGYNGLAACERGVRQGPGRASRAGLRLPARGLAGGDGRTHVHRHRLSGRLFRVDLLLRLQRSLHQATRSGLGRRLQRAGLCLGLGGRRARVGARPKPHLRLVRHRRNRRREHQADRVHGRKRQPRPVNPGQSDLWHGAAHRLIQRRRLDGSRRRRAAQL